MSLVAFLRVAVASVGLLSVVACAPRPTIICNDLRSIRPEAIDCREAVAVAITALPLGDEPTSAEFQYGTYCALTSGCGLTEPANRVDFGLVTFNYGNSPRHEYVYVAADANGRLRLAGTLSSSPPPLLSVPTPIP
jgi:hypothetical protein